MSHPPRHRSVRPGASREAYQTGEPRASGRRVSRGFAVADAVILLAVVALLAALAYPALKRRAFDGRFERVVQDVETLRRSALAYRDRTGAWAPGAGPRQRPPELGAHLDSLFAREAYGIEWRRWEVVAMREMQPPPVAPSARESGEQPVPTHVPVVRLLGGITVHTGEEALLAELAVRYGDSISFVYDTTWTLVLPDRTGQSPLRGLPFTR